MIIRLDESHIDEMLALQAQCIENKDIFLPTSREGYLRAFRYDNFCHGYMEDGRLLAFLNCSVPTSRARGNLGRDWLPKDKLDRVGHMNTLLVDRSCRRGGVGMELVTAALTEFMARGCPHIFVTASPQNKASLALLDRLNFFRLSIIYMQGEKRVLLYRNLSA